MSVLVDSAASTSRTVHPVFITIDPARDGPDQLKSYLSDWHPSFIGLTGTQEQTGLILVNFLVVSQISHKFSDDVCKKYRVYYSKAQLGPDPSDYLIDQYVVLLLSML